MKKIFTVFILVLIGVGLFFIYQTMALTPQKVLHKTAMEFLKVKTYHIAANINTDGKIKENAFNAKFKIDGAVDITDKNAPKFEGLLNGDIKSTGISFSASTQIKALKDELYFQLVSFPETLGNMKIPLDLSKFKTIWIKIPVKNHQDINAEFAQIDEKKLEEGLKRWFKERKFEKLPDENINEKSCFHYKLTLDKTSLNDLIQILESAIKEKQAPKSKDMANRALSKVNDINLELWIGKKDFLLHKANLLTQALLTGAEEKINLAVELSYSKYDEMLNIQKPDISVDLESLFAQFMKGAQLPAIKQMPDMNKR